MPPDMPDALDLRFRGYGGGSVLRPDIDAFRRALPRGAGEAAIPRSEPLGIVPGRATPQPDPDAAIVVFFQHASYPIPAIAAPGCAPVADPSTWRVRPVVSGYASTVRRGSARGRAACVVAACLPLVVPSLADAAPEPSRPRPTRVEPAVPDPPAADDAEPVEAADPVDDGAAVEVPQPEPELAADPAADPLPAAGPVEAPEPAVDRATQDAAWEGVDGFDVVIELHSGKTMRGRVGAVQLDTFTLIEAGTGVVLVLAKGSVASLRVAVPGPLPQRNGTGLVVGGGVLTGLGSPVFLSGIVLLAICPSCVSIHLPLLVVGGGALAGGIPMIARGTRLRRAYQRALDERQLGMTAMATPTGWSGGLRFRF